MQYDTSIKFPQRSFLLKKTKIMKITEYIEGTQAEMKHVNWPSKEQTTRYTIMVVIVSVAVAALLGASDFVFSKLLTLLF